jgi:hypothetical protein
MYQVRGEHGVDPTEPPTSEPCPFPPVTNEPWIEQLFDDMKRAGFHPFPPPPVESRSMNRTWGTADAFAAERAMASRAWFKPNLTPR